MLADSGYQGMEKYHACCKIPFKKTKLCPLTEEQKQANRQLAKIRIVVEHEHLKSSKFLLFVTQIVANVLRFTSILLLLYIIN